MVRLSVVALAAGVAAAALAAGAGSAARPSIRISGTDPIVVRGQSFRAKERIRVRISYAETRRFRLVRTNGAGAFTVAFDVPTPIDPCVDSVLVSATGPGGENATAKLPQRACPPAP